jgi:predicted Rossmann fold flavoprotein
LPRTLVVIGGGAAGFFCAANAARLDPSLKIVILEKSNKLLSKVRISGGGRCNVTHACFDIAEMSNRYPRGKNFVKKSFHQFFTTDTIQWFEERGVRLKTESDGRMFPVTDSSETIINCLLAEINRYKVEIRMSGEVRQVQQANNHFTIQLSSGEKLNADLICVASGGYPKASAFQWLIDLGHTISEPVPSLFTFNSPGNRITELMGVSVPQARVKIEGTKLSEEGPLLITHWGFSGPAVLKLSAAGARELASMQYVFKVHINWLPEWKEQSLRDKISALRMVSKKIVNENFASLPQRLWKFLLNESGATDEMRFTDLPSKVENALIRNLLDYTAQVRGKTTFKEEFVTAGGISLSEVDPNTMMSRKVPNLFFAGEVLDIDGITGGYNFQNAWTTGFVAAKGICHSSTGSE